MTVTHPDGSARAPAPAGSAPVASISALWPRPRRPPRPRGRMETFTGAGFGGQVPPPSFGSQQLGQVLSFYQLLQSFARFSLQPAQPARSLRVPASFDSPVARRFSSPFARGLACQILLLDQPFGTLTMAPPVGNSLGVRKWMATCLSRPQDGCEIMGRMMAAAPGIYIYIQS